ncbi:Preprotein translocase subunit SECE1 [Sesamum alatum]|uniref:Preprotein translocase subunit SECE1 n=1 Tax=Sesamum alatum TaxID=300844 RepID=A0AAE2CTJ1_9LAMI|nr:Preprotein translocase subunit SECE1 [Sesamum alatum]
MALSFSQFPFCPSSTLISPKSTRPNTTFPTATKPATLFTKHAPKLSQKPHKFTAIPKATGEDEQPPAESEEESSQRDEMTELGMEIKKAMKEKEQKEAGLVGGVAEEIREIEWPAFNKVLGTTGVVLGVIAGSSVVLLTVNAVLAEISDRVFAGRGVQDFFG